MSSVRITCNILIIAYVTICYSIQRIDQLMVDTVVRLQFRRDKHNTVSTPQKFKSAVITQEYESYFPQSISPKRGQISSLGQKYNKPKHCLFVIQ